MTAHLNKKERDPVAMPEISELQEAVEEISGSVGANSGIAQLDSSGKLPSAQLPTIAKDDVGLGNVDNTADANKPVSSAQQTALDGKQPVDPDLTTLAGLDSSTAGVIASTGAGWLRRTWEQALTSLGFTQGMVDGLDNASGGPLSGDNGVVSVGGLAPAFADYLAPRTPLLAYDYGVRADATEYSGIAINSGESTFTLAGLSSADEGKIVSIKGAGAAGDNLAASITDVAGTTVTISAAASTTVASADALIGSNNSAAIALLLAAIPVGGAELRFPRGGIMYSTQIAPPDFTRWIGEGREATTLYPISTVHGFYRLGHAGPTSTPDDEVVGVQWQDLAVDGQYATGQMKGWYLNHMKRCMWVRTSCLNTGASGYGVDYLRDCWFVDAIVENAGRAGTISSSGFSGYGIGTGSYTNEDCYLINCVARNNKRFGAFWENQDTATQSKGAVVIGGVFEGNYQGISDNGTDGIKVRDAEIRDNVSNGFILTTTAAIEQVGIRGSVSGCNITGNGGDGVQLDWTLDDSTTWGEYAIEGNLIHGNTGFGVRTRTADGEEITDILIRNNRIRSNGAAGIAVYGAMGESEIKGNRVVNNGTGGTYPRGIMIVGDLRNVDIDDNRVGDTATSGKTQLHGIWFSTATPAVTMTGGRLKDNNLSGNGTAAISGATQISSTTKVSGNDGYNPIGIDPVTVTGSPFTHTASYTRETLYVIGGTFSTITINGVTVYNAGANLGTIVLDLPPGVAAVFTYSVAPTAIKRYRH